MDFATKFISDISAVTVLSAEGVVLGDAEIVGTGCSVQIVDGKGTVSQTFTAVVKGDCTGDGLANSADVTAMMKDVKNVIGLSGIYLKAVDSDNDRVISTLDYIREKLLVKQNSLA